MEKRYRCYRRSSSSLAWRKNRSGIGIRRSRYASFVVLLGLTRVLQSDGDLYPGSFAPLFFHRREISDEIPPNGGTRYRGGERLPDGEKHRETRYSKILTREIYICIWISLFADDTNACEHGSASTFHFSARKGNLYPCRRNGILIIGMEEREVKKEFAFL